MAAIKNIFHVSFRVIAPMLQHRPFQNINPGGNEFKIFYKKNVTYWLIHTDFRIQEVSRESCKSDKQTRAAHSFVYRIYNSLGKYFLYLKVNVN